MALSAQSQIVIDFCPIDKIQAQKQWNGTITIQNNTGVVLEFTANKLKMDWPSLVTLPYPFQNFTQTGINWEFEIAGVSTWDSKMPVGANWVKAFTGGAFSGVLQFPTTGSFTQGGIIYTVEVNHCAKTEAYELYDATIAFNRDCFIKSPTENMCLGEAGTEIWQGEGVFDAMMPTDRPSWAIGTMVAHRLFTNMAGAEMLSPNFWTATAMNESRMTCDPTIAPDQNTYWPINSIPNSGIGVYSATDNCFQVLNIGYSQLQNNQPDLFSQTNTYGTATYATVIAGGRYETGALAVAYYHYQDIRYWNQIFCWNAKKFHQDAVDPYAVEKVFYHAFHDGPNAGISLLTAIDANYAAAVAATNMNTVISSGGTWDACNGGSSQKVGNFTSLLDGNGKIYPASVVCENDNSSVYYGCYEESIKWTDILFYLDKVKILYPQLMDAPVQAAIKAVFDGLNGGGDVLFSNLGPVIDEIVIQMGGHDPSGYLATQYSASKVCNENPVGVSLRTNDTLCPGEPGFLQVWLAGDPTFRVDIKFPDGTTNSYTGINSSPYNIAITQPGDYEVVYFEDADEVGDIDCNFSNLTIESKNGTVVGWDKTNLDATKNCATGDLIVTKTGAEQVTISYTKDGVVQTDVVMTANETSKSIATGVVGGQYIITTITPNSCGVPINDTLSFCNSACTKPPYTILTPDTSICAGDTAQVRISFSGTQPYALYFTPNGLPQVTVPNITTDFYNIPVNIGGSVTVDSVADNTCTNDTSKSLTITIDALPILSLGNDTTICGTGLTLYGGPFTTYEWQETPANNTQTFAATTAGANDYILKVTNTAGCEALDTVNVTLNPTPTAVDVRDTSLCLADLPISLNATQGGVTYLWSDASTGSILNAAAAGDYWVIVTQGGCSDTDSVAITLKGVATVNLGNDTIICGTSLVLDALAGQTTYRWMENAADNGQTFTASTTGSNEYRVEVSNSDGCISRDTINVTLNPKPVFNFSPSDTVFACSSSFPVNLDATTASATYGWNDASSSPTLGVNVQGDYWVIVTLNGCSDTDSVYVKESSTLSLDLGIDTTVCPGQFITLNPVVNYSNISYTWSDGSSGTSLTTSTPGKIYLDIADAGGCAGVDTLELFNNNPLVINLGADQTALCFGDTADLELTPARTGLNYSWDNGAGQVSTDSLHSVWAEGTATYTLTVDSAGCTFNDDVIVTINALPTVSLGVDTFVCQGVGATITLDAGAGQANYLWNDGSGNQTLVVSGAGDYDVLVTDGNGCITKDTLTVAQKIATIIALTSDQTICPAGSGVVTLDPTSVAENGASWIWTNDNSMSPASTYTVQNQVDGDVVIVAIDYINEFGCVTSAASTVTVSNVLAVTGLNDQALCEGGNYSGFTTDFETAANRLDYTYAWHDATTGTNFPVNNVTMAENNTAITVTVTDNVLGCTGSASATLTVNPLPVPVLTDETTCLGTAVTIDSQLSSAAYTFSWTKNGTLMTNSNIATQMIDGSTAGVDTYVVTAAVDATTCSASATSVITTIALPEINLGIPAEVCEGVPVIIPVAGGQYSVTTHDHVWSLNGIILIGETGNTFQASLDGTYSLTVTETATTCSNNQNVVLDFISTPDVEIIISDSVICEGTTAMLEASELNSNYNYDWYFSTDVSYRGSEVTNGADEERISDANESGFYTLIVTPKQANCPVTAITSLLVRELPTSGIQSDTIVCFEEMKGGPMVLDASPMSSSRFPSYTFLWNNGDSTKAINITAKGNYSVVITDDEGCSGEGEVLISEDCMPNVWVATGFTPNGDSKNETWGIEGRGISSMEVLVFNRWGEQIWRGTSTSDKWDGRFGANAVPQDVYVWVLQYSFFDVLNNEQTKKQTGTVAVVR